MYKKTVEYYNNNAEKFVSDTLNCEFHEMQDKFLNYLQANSNILDLGCGSGRDSKYFIEKGHNVSAIDASQELCKIAKKLIKKDVICKDFRTIDYNNEFNGIWACASLLHLTKEDIYKVINKCVKSLKINGILYCSFKYGDFEGYRNGRYFTDLTEQSLNDIIIKIDNIKLKEILVSNDVRKGREKEKWLNIFIAKTNDETSNDYYVP